MKRLLLIGILLVSPSAAHTKPIVNQCPGITTVDMVACANTSLRQSDAQLRQKVSKPLLNQWQKATRALCASAYAPYRDGTIYSQLALGCSDHLNRALLEEFKRLGN